MHEVFKLHLLKFAYTEYKFPRRYLVTECFSNLSDTKRYFYSCGGYDILKVYINPLTRLSAKIRQTRTILNRSDKRSEKEIKLTWLGPCNIFYPFLFVRLLM